MRVPLSVTAFGLLAATVLMPGAAQAQADDAPVSTAKLAHYVKGFNFLVGTFGLSDQFRLYTAQGIGRRPAASPVAALPINVGDGWIGLGDEELTKARAMPNGGLAEVDDAADTMVPVLDRLVERLKGLQAYYASREQLEDGGTRGRREDPLVLADFQAALAALGPLGTALDRAEDRRDTARLLALKEEGDMVGFNGGIALGQAKQLVRLFRTPEDVRNPVVLARGDTLADAILSALADETTALAEAKASGDTRHGLRNSTYSTAADRLRGMVGTFRDMKRTGNPALRPLLVAGYNAAIESVNVGQ